MSGLEYLINIEGIPAYPLVVLIAVGVIILLVGVITHYLAEFLSKRGFSSPLANLVGAIVGFFFLFMALFLLFIGLMSS